MVAIDLLTLLKPATNMLMLNRRRRNGHSKRHLLHRDATATDSVQDKSEIPTDQSDYQSRIDAILVD